MTATRLGRRPVLVATGNLPAERDEFIGRTRELELLAEQIGQGSRLVTLKGPGGVGKTRLSRRFGRDPGASFPGGVWFVPLDGARTATQLVHAVADVLDLQLAAGPPVAALGRALGACGRLLLILDNFEQLASFADETVGAWLDLAPAVVFVVTSRQTLGLAGERVMDVSLLSESEGTSLFQVRARACGAGWIDDDAHGPAIARIVQRLGCLPLAVELVAGRAAQFSVETLGRLLDDPLRLLASRRRDRPARQQSLQALIGWSWDLLEEWERAALIQITVLRGGFRLEALEDVLDLSAWSQAPWAPDVLAGLLERSLLFRQDIAEPRYGMYPSVRAFCEAWIDCDPAPAGDRALDGAEELAGARMRHARHFARLGLRPASGKLRGRGAIPAMGTEMENLLWGVDGALAVGDGDSAGLCALAMAFVIEARGPLTRSTTVLRRVLDESTPSSAVHERVSSMLAYLLLKLGREPEAMALLDELQAAGEAPENGQAALRRLSNLGFVGMQLRAAGRLEEAAGVFAQIVAGHTHLEKGPAQARALSNEADVLIELGDLEDARTRLEAALQLARASETDRAEAVCLVNLARVEQAASRDAEAQAVCRSALDITLELGDSRTEGVVLGLTGELHLRAKELDLAALALERAVALCGDALPRYAGRFRGGLAVLLARTGDLDTARRELELGLEQLAGTCALGWICALARRVEVELLAGDLEASQAALIEAEARVRELGLGPGTRAWQEVEEGRRLLGAESRRPSALVVDARARWFRRGSEEAVWLTRRKSLQQIFAALVEQRRRAPGTGLPIDEVREAGWPGERISLESGRARVYTAVSSLRTMGLDEVLVRRPDGYLLDPNVALKTTEGD